MATPTPPTQSAAAAGGTANPTSSADAALNAAQLVALEAKRRQDKAALLRSKIPRTLKRPRYNPRASRGIGMRRLRTNRFDVVNLAGTLLQDGHMAHMLKQMRQNTVLRTFRYASALAKDKLASYWRVLATAYSRVYCWHGLASVRSIADNWLTTSAVKRLCHFLHKTAMEQRLLELSLAYNEFDDDGIDTIADMLERPTCQVRILRLGGNKYGTRGVKRLARAIVKGNDQLSRLQLVNYEWPCLEVCHKVVTPLLPLGNVALRRRDAVFFAEVVALGLGEGLMDEVTHVE